MEVFAAYASPMAGGDEPDTKGLGGERNMKDIEDKAEASDSDEKTLKNKKKEDIVVQ